MPEITASMVKELRERTGLGMMDCKKALVAAQGDLDVAIEDLRKSSGMKAAKKAGRIAADGIVAVREAGNGSCGVLVEINSETDFVARDANFLNFVNQVADRALAQQQDNVEALMAGELESAREALIQKIGENISVRRIAKVDSGQIGSYVHSNGRIGVLVTLKGGSKELAKDVAMHVAAVNPQYVNPAQVPENIISKEKEILIAQVQDSDKPADIVEKMIGGRIRKFLAEISLTEQSFVKNPDVTVGKLVASAGAEILTFVRYEVGEGIEKEQVDFADEVAAAAAAQQRS